MANRHLMLSVLLSVCICWAGVLLGAPEDQWLTISVGEKRASLRIEALTETMFRIRIGAAENGEPTANPFLADQHWASATRAKRMSGNRCHLAAACVAR